jgi:LCP family protein required for cell wall assembly
LAWTLYGLACLAALAIGTAGGWLSRSPLIATAVTNTVKDAVGVKRENPFETTSDLTLLVLGCDADYTRGGKRIVRKYARSDMIMVVRLDLVTKKVSGVSIPRDTLASAGGRGEQKINAYHSFGGPELAQEAVETLLPGVRIDRVIVLDFDAFQEMVDIAGGVEVDIQKRMRWTDKAAKLKIDLKPGLQTLNGYDAMGFVRYRHTDSDMHRMERQRQFMLAFKQAVFSNPLRIPDIANKAVEVLNGSLNNEEILSLAEFTKELPDDSIKIGTLPTVDAGSYNLRVDSTKLQETLEEFGLVPITPSVARAEP